MNTAATRAAIKRASQQARNAMRDLDKATAEELLALYQDAADEVRAAIHSRAGAQDMVPLSALRDLLRQIEDVVDALGQRRDALLLQGMDDAAGLGVRPYTLQGVLATGRTAQATLDSAAAIRVSEEAVTFVRAFTAADGLRLSDRLWRLDQGAKEVLARAIGRAVVAGWDATRAAQDLMLRGQAVPRDVTARQGAARADALGDAADLLVSGDNSELWKAQRVMRTEINRAHGTAYMAAAEKTPGFAGFRFLLSPRHPKPDICDLLAAQNLYGLGAGVYPSADTCPWPAHPNTLSFVEIVFADEVSDADRAGKETVTDAMGRMSPEVREGILGVEKAALHDAGQVKPWMIRSPLYAVKQRLLREGAIQSPPITPLMNARRADIAAEKLLGYTLNPDHPVGGNKARVFASVLGITRDNYRVLQDALYQGLPASNAVAKDATRHGQKYQVDIRVTGPAGSAMVRTGWIVRVDEDFPRLTSAYVMKGKKP